MKIRLNGKDTVIEHGVTISDLIREKGVKADQSVVQLNSEIIERGAWSSIELKDQDDVEILRFVGGG